MKLASYYKKNKEIVILSPIFAPDRHQKFYLRKDFNDGNYKKDMDKIPNLAYGGYAFTNNVYFPLPKEIETMQPDSSIYAKMESTILSKQDYANRKKIFQNMITAEHCRLSLDGKTIWEDYPKQFKQLTTARNLMIHDYDLGKIEGGYEEIRKILRRARTDGWATKVGMKFPTTIENGEQLLKWIRLNPNSTFFSLRYDGIIEEEAFEEFIGLNRDRAIYSTLDYCVTAKSINQQDFIDNCIQDVFRQIVKARFYRVFYTINYEQDFFIDPMWERVLDLFNFYHNSMKTLPQSIYYNEICTDTLFDFAKNSQKLIEKSSYYGQNFLSKEEIREIFYFVREHKPDLFDDFYNYNIKRWEENKYVKRN